MHWQIILTKKTFIQRCYVHILVILLVVWRILYHIVCDRDNEYVSRVGNLFWRWWFWWVGFVRAWLSTYCDHQWSSNSTFCWATSNNSYPKGTNFSYYTDPTSNRISHDKDNTRWIMDGVIGPYLWFTHL